MMNQLFLTDNEVKEKLFPFTLTRSAAEIRVGILTIREKWEILLGKKIKLTTEEIEIPDSALILPSNIIPSRQFVQSITAFDGGFTLIPGRDTTRTIQYPWDIFALNDWAIREDYEVITSGRKSQSLPASVQTVNPENIFIEEGARLSHCIINASAGPVYIGHGAEIMEGSLIRGPVAICEGASVKMGTRIYGATTIGPYSMAGGEIKNSVMFGYSNKAHDGYLGDSVIGEWCNLGGGTTNSNIKNDAGAVKVWNQASGQFVPAGIKCGLIMGDYSRAAINTSFNTGTLTGVCVNVFGEGLTPSFIPSFTWGIRPMKRYDFEKALTHIENWKKLKSGILTDLEKKQLKLIFDKL